MVFLFVDKKLRLQLFKRKHNHCQLTVSSDQRQLPFYCLLQLQKKVMLPKAANGLENSKAKHNCKRVVEAVVPVVVEVLRVLPAQVSAVPAKTQVLNTMVPAARSTPAIVRAQATCNVGYPILLPVAKVEVEAGDQRVVSVHHAVITGHV